MGGGEPRLIRYGITDQEAWGVGLHCGGEIDVWIESYEPPEPVPGDDGPDALTAAFADLERRGGRGLVTLIEGDAPGAKLLVLSDGTLRGSLGTATLDEAAVGHADELTWGERSVLRKQGVGALFIDITGPPSRLFIFGAVDYAAALCTMARATGWVPFVIDPRSGFAQATRFPDAAEVVAAWPAPAFAQFGEIDRATAMVV